MNGVEIRRQIDLNNQLIKDALTPNMFVLDKVVSKLLEENKKLRQNCNHQFEGGICIYCDEQEGNN